MQWTLLGFVVTLVILCVMEEVGMRSNRKKGAVA